MNKSRAAFVLLVGVVVGGCGASDDGVALPSGMGGAGPGGLAPASGGALAGSGGATGTGGSPAAGSGGIVGAAGGGGSGGIPGSGGTPTVGSGGGSGGTTPSNSGGTPSSGGAGGTSSSGGAPSSGGSSATGGSGGGTCETGKLQPNDVVFLGDSYLNLTTVVQHLEELMQAGKSSAYSALPRRYDLLGYNMTQIVGTYPTAKAAGQPKVVIMTGGGNDVLLGDRSCLSSAPPANTGCAQTVANATNLAKTLMATMAQDGVQHVVYFFYPHMRPDAGIGTGTATNATLDYAYPLAKAACDSQPNCVFVDTRAAFEGHLTEYLNANDVHPSDAGSKAIAGLVWDAMKANCIAQ